MAIVLPKERTKAIRRSPKFMVIFAKPKHGKTTALSLLDNCLIVDMEDGSDHVDGLKIKITNIKDLFGLANQIEEEGKPYKYIALDTATALEEYIIMPYAIKLYQATPVGKNFSGDDLRKLPNGAGYLYIREAFKNVIDRFTQVCDTLILVAHCNEKQIEKEGKEMFELEMDLAGKLKRIISAKADAIALLYRKGFKSYLNFNGGGDAIIEARSEHLANKEFLLVEKTDKGFVHNWNQIFI